jgi:hypothetical protein
MLHGLLYLNVLFVCAASALCRYAGFCGWCVRGRGGKGTCMRRSRPRNIPGGGGGWRADAHSLALLTSLALCLSLSLSLTFFLWHPPACLTSRTGQVRQRISARGRRKWIAERTRGGGNQVRHMQRNRGHLGGTSGPFRGHLYIRPFSLSDPCHQIKYLKWESRSIISRSRCTKTR